MSDTETTGEVIKRARLAKPLTQKELASRVGVTVSTISAIERDVVLPNAELLDLIVDELGLYNIDIFGMFGYEFEYPAMMEFIDKLPCERIKRLLKRIARG